MDSNAIWQEVLAQARLAATCGEVPVGAVIIQGGEIIAASHNRTETDRNAAAHAEMLVLDDACRQVGEKYLPGCDLYVSLEPCVMCAGAIALTRIRRLYYGAYDPKAGAVDHGVRVFNQRSCHHRPDIYGGIRAGECGALLQDFFASRR